MTVFEVDLEWNKKIIRADVPNKTQYCGFSLYIGYSLKSHHKMYFTKNFDTLQIITKYSAHTACKMFREIEVKSFNCFNYTKMKLTEKVQFLLHRQSVLCLACLLFAWFAILLGIKSFVFNAFTFFLFIICRYWLNSTIHVQHIFVG